MDEAEIKALEEVIEELVGEPEDEILRQGWHDRRTQVPDPITGRIIRVCMSGGQLALGFDRD